MESNINELRKNFRLREMEAGWAAKRREEKAVTKVHIDAIRLLGKKNVEMIKNEAEQRIMAANAQMQADIMKEEADLDKRLIALAKEEDDYLHELRNYIASLPRDEREAYAEEESK